MSSNIPQPPSASAASWRDTVMREVGDTGEPLYYLADGRNRLDAIELAGFNTIATKRSRGRAHRRREGMECGLDLFLGLPDRLEVAINYISPPDDTYAFVVSANIHRRHLTAEQKRELIAKLLKSTPEQSDRQIAETVKVDHKTVGAVRAEQEGRGEIPHVETRTDAKGRKQPAKKPSAKPASPPPPPEVRETIPQLIDGLKAEGRKNMATMSPGTVARLAALLERKLEAPRPATTSARTVGASASAWPLRTRSCGPRSVVSRSRTKGCAARSTNSKPSWPSAHPPPPTASTCLNSSGEPRRRKGGRHDRS